MSANKATDCSGLVSAAAYLAGYSWATQKYGTSGLNGVSREIDKNDLQPGDILNKAGSHVVVVVKVTRENNAVSTVDIIHASGDENEVLHEPNKSITEYDKFKARRLCLNSSNCE
ncbi:MAG TPA: NlpC/P60 family protein [bacterium]|nr:NlpC/P60 family protein [bacterium]